jgi:hypothetical protein
MNLLHPHTIGPEEQSIFYPKLSNNKIHRLLVRSTDHYYPRKYWRGEMTL